MKNPENKIRFNVKGMHCKSCGMLVKEEISAIPGVETVTVDHKSGEGYLTASEELDNNLVLNAIKNAGYTGTIEKSGDANGNGNKD